MKGITMNMTNFSTLLTKLQKSERKQAALYLFCNFVSLLLITAYSAMMFSPTVLLVLPEGGDSRKQMAAIFVLALFGCVVFTIYASCLFFRKKAKQLSILMALGASRKKLAPGLYKEVITLSGISSFLGILGGFPLVVLIWNVFRLFIVDSTEMQLRLDFRFLFLSVIFWFLVVGFSCLTAYRYLKRTNIMDVVQEEHKNEPIKELGTWCGPIGFVLLLIGAITGYFAPSVYYALVDGQFPPVWLSIFYLPVFPGLYMMILHTVVHGWRSYKKHPYKNIIARSMMKFQGKQTVNNLLVSTVLIAGASFAIFYLPMVAVGAITEIHNRPYHYRYHYPMTQYNRLPDQASLSEMAAEYQLSITDWHESPYILLAMDGMRTIDDSETTYHEEYTQLYSEGRFFSESNFHALTGIELDVKSGTYIGIANEEETALYYLIKDSTLFTNMTTQKTLPVTFAGFTHYDFLFGEPSYYVLDDTDYTHISEGLSTEWMESMVFFNVAEEDSYAFANAFFDTLVTSYEPQYAIPSYYDRIYKQDCENKGTTYWGDTDTMTKISFEQPDTADFRNYWLYMPKNMILDKTDFLRNYAVFLMIFLFISIICILAALVISYTRCMTITLNNRYVFDDLRKLGASPRFLKKEVRNQASNVFVVPSAIGMSIMYLLYTMIMFANDGKLTSGEVIGLGVCLVILFLFAGILYLVYRYTVRQMCKQLDILYTV